MKVDEMQFLVKVRTVTHFVDRSSLSSRIQKLKLAGKYQRQRDLWLQFI